jgi:predicted nucleic acid-binding protein
VSFAIEPAPIVIDASFAVALITGDEASQLAFGEAVASSALLIVPPHFWVEMANALLRSVRLATPDVTARLERLGATRIGVADRGMAGMLEAVALAERHRLTVYDAAYLQLALDVDGTLATFDDDLRRAATSDEVPLLV